MRTAFKTLSTLLLFGSALLFAGCRSVEMKTPAGFARYEKRRKTYFLAVSPDAVILHAYRVKNKPKGSLEVLTDTSLLHFKSLGYRVLESKPVRTASGMEGRMILASVQTMSGEYLYLTAFFLKNDRVYVVESGGEKDKFRSYQEEIIGKLSTLRPGWQLP